MTRQTFQKASGYRPDIDGLRAIAVLAVVFYHAGLPGFSGGFVGVDIFFVISGFLITGIVWKDLNRQTFSLQDFYMRRIKRIFPALFAVLFVTSIAAFILLIPLDLAEFGKSLNAALLFSSNFFFLKNANYFDGPSIEKPLLHTWSLSLEEQFYAVWPLVLLLLIRAVPVRRVPHVIIFLGLVSLAFAEARLTDYQKDAFYFPWCRGWELLLGAALAVTAASARTGRLATLLAGAGIAAISVPVTLYDPSTRFPGLTALLPCAGAALIIASGASVNPVSRLLSFGPVRLIGLISYSLYLIHWPLFSFAHLYFSEEPSLGLRLAIIGISLVLAYACWRFIETPCRAASFPRFAVFGAAATAMVGMWLTGAAFWNSQGFPWRVDEKVLQIESPQRDLSKYCRTVSVPGTGGGTACEIGAGGSGNYDFILWGDSHAHHFLPAISTLAEANNMSGLLFWRGACHPFVGDSHTSKDCRQFNEAVTQWIGKHPVKIAILSSRWSTHGKFLRKYIAKKDEGGLEKTLAFLNGKGIQVSILDQVPDYPQEVSLCIARATFYGRAFEPCVVQPFAGFERRHGIVDFYFEFLKQNYSFSVSSLINVLCDREQCRAHNGKLLLMSDSNHLTEAGALYLAPYLAIPLLSKSAFETAVVERTALPSGNDPALP